MSEAIQLDPVDQVKITTLFENLVDRTTAGGGAIERLDVRADNMVVSNLLNGEMHTEFVGGHGLSMLVRLTRGGITRSVLFDAGGTPEGLAHNMDCLELKPQDWRCIVFSHGHWDHTLGLIGLHQRLGHLRFPLTLHPDAYLNRVTLRPNGEVQNQLIPPSRQGLRNAGVELIETKNPSFVVEGVALVTGQVARTNDFETGWPAHQAIRNGVLEPDPLICDDQGLVVSLRGKGLVVLSGCGHAGIVNTVHHAQAITGIPQVHAVIGGFHLGPTFFHDRIGTVVDALVALDPAIISPAHCAGYRAACAVYQARPDAFVQNTVGTRITMKAAPD